MQHVIKRTADIVFSLIGLILLSPVLFFVGMAIYFKLGTPIFFTQERLGYKGKIFKMVKFRTMLDTRDKKGRLLSDGERLTPFGKKLRSLSIDELPELWNVLKGDMSLVGPRPLIVEYRDKYSKNQFRRHDIRPGITGWAQINGRNALTWGQRFHLDVWYVDNFSVWLDAKILFLTIYKVVKRDGVDPEQGATMEKFTGSN